MSDLIDRAATALEALCGERSWRYVSLRDVADKAAIPLAELYAVAPSKVAIIDHLGGKFDAAALATAATPSEDVHDRLFDAAMARIEAMGAYRATLASVEGEALALLAPHLPRAARAILEAAGVEASTPRLAAMTLVWARVLQVWRADEGAYNRTMAEIDKRLKQMRARLASLGAGF